MITALLSPAPPAALLSRSCGPSQLSSLRRSSNNVNQRAGRRARPVGCRAALEQDAPFAAAIGASILTSLVSPVPHDDGDDDGGAIGSTDARLAVMGIISFIPYFNWMSWVFAWLDSGRQRYLVYAIVYLAPYLRTNLSLSPEESWLPIASILLCIIHIQLEASIRNGDLENIQFLNEIWKLTFPLTKKKDKHSQKTQGFSRKGGNKQDLGLPSAEEGKLHEWGIPGKQFDESHLNEKLNVDSKETESD